MKGLLLILGGCLQLTDCPNQSTQFIWFLFFVFKLFLFFFYHSIGIEVTDGHHVLAKGFKHTVSDQTQLYHKCCSSSCFFCCTLDLDFECTFHLPSIHLNGLTPQGKGRKAKQPAQPRARDTEKRVRRRRPARRRRKIKTKTRGKRIRKKMTGGVMVTLQILKWAPSPGTLVEVVF